MPIDFNARSGGTVHLLGKLIKIIQSGHTFMCGKVGWTSRRIYSMATKMCVIEIRTVNIFITEAQFIGSVELRLFGIYANLLY